MSYSFNNSNNQVWSLSSLALGTDNPIAYAWARMMNNHNISVGPAITDVFTSQVDNKQHQLFLYGEAVYDTNSTTNPNHNIEFITPLGSVGSESGL